MKNKQPKLPANLRGKFVSRASFAKMQGERNRLLSDIKVLISGSTHRSYAKVFFEWQEKFKQQRWFDLALREIARQELSKLQEKYRILPKIDKNQKQFK